MIGCENEDCMIEWFHYECVGVIRGKEPKKWYCPECEVLRKKGKLVKR